MNSSPSLESGLFRSYWDDGLLDLLFGLALLTIGLSWNVLGAFATLSAPLWITLWIPLRHRLVEPRAGYVRFSISRQRHNRRQLGLTLAFGLGCLVVVVFSLFVMRKRGFGAPTTEWVAGLPAFLVALGSALGGVLTRASRFFLYAVVLLLCAVFGVLAGQGPEASLLAGGIVILLSALFLVTRFLRASRAFALHPGN